VFLFKSNSRNDTLGALVMETDGVAVARVSHQKPDRPLLEYCAFHPLAPGQDQASLLKKTLAANQLGKVPLSSLLAIGDYQLLMVEAPEVPAAELKAAIRWRIRDLIDFHIDDAVLDVFDVPPSGARGVQQHMYVVVSREALVKERAELLQTAGGELKIVDIPELALRNIAARLDRDTSGQALLYFGSDHGLITLTRDATLYLARSMDLGYQQLLESPELVDRLALELQRSMDYYDRHFQQAPITAVTVCPMPQPLPQFADQLAQQTGIAVHALRLEDIVEVDPAVDVAQFPRCVLAVGAALRSEPAQL
jgi:MSHA biogenesis protein MshI